MTCRDERPCDRYCVPIKHAAPPALPAGCVAAPMPSVKKVLAAILMAMPAVVAANKLTTSKLMGKNRDALQAMVYAAQRAAVPEEWQCVDAAVEEVDGGSDSDSSMPGLVENSGSNDDLDTEEPAGRKAAAPRAGQAPPLRCRSAGPPRLATRAPQARGATAGDPRGVQPS